ncbi:hypothetical protein ATSB10_02050 [Dyella thiooxydans]|uniref:Uncharacterized protein n=1 Tax=Dyella thiooxydans TaxID=445710 RepID=A0A161J6Y4_9GAMM|nr:hypothetical protein ATSB10_02050 [Dyella thiooxydans]
MAATFGWPLSFQACHATRWLRPIDRPMLGGRGAVARRSREFEPCRCWEI